MDEGTQEKINEIQARWDNSFDHNRDLLLKAQGNVDTLYNMTKNRADLADLNVLIGWLRPVLLNILNLMDAMKDSWTSIVMIFNEVKEHDVKIGTTSAAVKVLTEILNRYKPVLDELEKDYADKLGRINP